MAATRPLLFLTRPEAASLEFWDALPDDMRKCVDLLVNPLLSIRVTGQLPQLDGCAGVIFTSANAVTAYQSLGGGHVEVPVFAVGEATAAAARAISDKVQVAGGNADRLVHFILENQCDGPLMHLRGDVAIGDVAQRLSEAGVKTHEAILYEQHLEPINSSNKEALSQDRPIIAPVFSPRTACQLVRESEELGAMSFAAISPAVAKALSHETAQNVSVADVPNRDGMVRLVTKMIKAAVALERNQRQL